MGVRVKATENRAKVRRFFLFHFQRLWYNKEMMQEEKAIWSWSYWKFWPSAFDESRAGSYRHDAEEPAGSQGVSAMPICSAEPGNRKDRRSQSCSPSSELSTQRTKSCGVCESCRRSRCSRNVGSMETLWSWRSVKPLGVDNIRDIKRTGAVSPTSENIKCLLSTKCICFPWGI